MAQLPFDELKNYPYYLIGAITGRTSSKKSKKLTKGSGALISSNLVITGAHVVMNRK